MFKVMMNDLEVYKQKADMSKELATFFSPFTPINQFSQEELFKQPQSRDKVLDMRQVIKGGQAERIKQMELELQNLRDVKRMNEKLQNDLKVQKDSYHTEK